MTEAEWLASHGYIHVDEPRTKPFTPGFCDFPGCLDGAVTRKGFCESHAGSRVRKSQQGWLCPRCQAINAPHVVRCECRP